MNAAGSADDGLAPLRKVWAILSARERRQLLLLAPAVVVVGILETLGVASVVPFLGLLSDPSLVERKAVLSWLYQAGHFTSRSQFFFAVGLGVLLLVSLGNAISALSSWGLLRFSWMRSHTLATRLLDSYLRQPYVFFLEKNSAELGKNILSEVGSVVTGVIIQGLQLFARFIVACGIVSVLFVVDPGMAVGVLLIFGFVYGGLFILVRRRVVATGRERVTLNQARHKTAQECLGGVKELKLYGLEPVALRQFSVSSYAFADRQAANAVLAQIPRYALETIAFGGVLVMTLYLLRAGRRLEDVLPVLGLYAFAAYRLLPALQIVFAGITTLRFNLGSLDILHRDIIERTAAGSLHVTAESVAFDRRISIDDVSFGYRSAMRPTLEKISLGINRGEWVALVGTTGAGKSTLVDVLLGLLEPDSGVVRVDGEDLRRPGQRLGWQKHVAYVPQQIFLMDDSLLRNIAFGWPDAEIDRERAITAARTAQIHDFIIAELLQGYDTVIGERGVRLSGGQRQRIGIARALYRQPKFLVLDEATSALDNATEDAFFSALRSSHAETTVLSIAHRLSTTREFDRVLILERGRIIDEGTYDDLQKRSAYFRLGREAA